MDSKKLEYIILYVLVGSTILVLSGIVRLFALTLGFDEFSANIAFVAAVAIISIIYLSIHVLLQSALIPIISRLLLKIPYFRKQQKIDKSLSESVRDQNNQKQLEQNSKLLETALQYTRTTFAPYASDDEIERLCEYIVIYSFGNQLKDVKPIKVKDLQSIDIFHFGWNIWSHFKPIRKNKQEDIALFLKLVFAITLKDVEIETIKKKLTFSEKKCEISLQKEL